MKVGVHALEITAQGGIRFVSPQPALFDTASIELRGAKTVSQSFQDSPVSRFDEKFQLVDPEGRPVANRRVRITRADGSSEEHMTDARGELPVQRSLEPEQIRIDVLRSDAIEGES